MPALANDPWTWRWIWTFVALGLLLAAWAGARGWSRRRAAQTRAIRARLTDGTLSPRAQHYYFAHVAIKGVAFEDPERLVIAMAAPEAETFLADMWDAVGKDVGVQGRQQRPRPQQGGVADTAASAEYVPPTGLEAVPARVAGRPAALIRMPEPQAATEAHFVAVVLNHELAEPAKPPPEPEAYYFTLELGVSSDGSLRTVFCEWDESAHRNHGDGPPADARAFLDHVARHLASRPKPAPQASWESEE
jgi:hypothetical protein